jgi:hypothetical protein
MWQTGQHPAKDPHTYIPRRQPHGSKTLGEGQRPTPRPSIDGVWGSQTGEVAVVGGLVESFSLGGRRSWGAKLGVGGVRHVLWVHMSWKLVCRGYRMEMCERMTWKKSIATLSIGSQSRASPAWQVWIC